MDVVDERTRFVFVSDDSGSFTMAELCRIYGIARKTGYVSVERYEGKGLAGLKDRRFHKQKLLNRKADWPPSMWKKTAVNWQLLSMEAPPSPLSSRPKRSVVERSLCGCSFLERSLTDLRFQLLDNVG